MRLLLDTHTFLWFVAGSNELSQTAKLAIQNPQNEKFVSMASLWEMSIKTSLGKLSIGGGYANTLDDVDKNGFNLLPILFPHLVCQNVLAFHHKDPFDRLLIGQALVENMNIVGKDEIFDMYLQGTNTSRIW
jgi:PIN domain nuclease of toxin-antitoxin system